MGVHAGCWTAVEFVRPPVCVQCGTPFAAPVEGIGSATHRCGKCLLSPPPYERARAVGLYEGDVARGHPRHEVPARVRLVVRPLAELLSGPFAVHWGGRLPDALVPVPLHRLRLRRREFDQALALANGLGAGNRDSRVEPDVDSAHAHPVADRPERHRTPPQHSRGVPGATGRSCEGRSLLLIDDVYTTGATAQECARTLRRAGAARVDVYTVARVG